jgi:hypothetical protein
MKTAPLIIICLISFFILPAAAEPPLQTWGLSRPLDTSAQAKPITPEIHSGIVKIPPKRTRWQRFRTWCKKYGVTLLRIAANGAEVAGSIAQLLQYAHHP